MSNLKSQGLSAFRTKKSSSNIFSNMPEYKSKSTFRRRSAVRHSKCRLSRPADYLIKYTDKSTICSGGGIWTWIDYTPPVPSPTTRPVATLPDRPPRRDDVLVFYSDDIA